MKILIEVSARHVHLSQRDFEMLFGKGAILHIKKELSQPGQFVCSEKVDIVGLKDVIKNVTVLSPIREKTQVEISITDARKLGISAPIRESGDLSNTPGCTLVGKSGKVFLKEGIIVAKRHIHLDKISAEKFGLTDKQKVKVRVFSEQRALIFDDVVIQVSENFLPAMHIDTDEANAAGISNSTYGEIII